MKRVTALVTLIFLWGTVSPVFAETHAEDNLPDLPELEAETALLMEAQSGQILYSKNPDKPMFPASITKILTGILAIESGQLDEKVTVSENARRADGTRVYLEVGEEKTLIDLVYGMLVNSGNDAAIAIAEYLGGSVSGFADMMNEKAEVLGATRSHFVNPSGLPDENHVTTARDMALIARYALKNETFRQIVGTKEYAWEGEGWEPGQIVNHNRLLWEYEGATGVKNGYTDASQYTFVASSTREGQKMIAVCFSAPTSEAIYRDLANMMDYGYAGFETFPFTVSSEELSSLQIGEGKVTGKVAEQQYYVTLPRGVSVADVELKPVLDGTLSPPIEKGGELGMLQLTYNGEVLNNIPLFAATAVTAQVKPGHGRFDEGTEREATFPWPAWVLSLAVFMMSGIYLQRRRLHNRRMREKFKSYRTYER